MGESANGGDEVEVEEVANPVEGGDDGDSLLGEIEDLLSEPLGLVFGVPGGHDREDGETGHVGVSGGLYSYRKAGTVVLGRDIRSG